MEEYDIDCEDVSCDLIYMTLPTMQVDGSKTQCVPFENRLRTAAGSHTKPAKPSFLNVGHSKYLIA